MIEWYPPQPSVNNLASLYIMGIFDNITSGFSSLGHFLDNNVVHPFTNKVLSPIYDNVVKPVGNIITRPIREANNIASGIEKMTEVWEKRAGSLTNDTITSVDKGITGLGNTFKGFGDMFSTPIIPIALGIGALYIIKK